MSKIAFNVFLFFAVPVITKFTFRVIFIGGKGFNKYKGIAIMGKRTGLPAMWDDWFIKRYWYDRKKLEQFEDEVEYAQSFLL